MYLAYSVVALSLFSIHCDSSKIDSKSSALNKLAQSLSKDDLLKLLRSAVDKKEKCSKRFSVKPNTILQVKNSEGSVLLKHTFAITSFESCLEACCDYNNRSQRCDLALFHDSTFDRDNSTAGCYLFQCYLPGKAQSVCETVPFDGYTLMERMVPADHRIEGMAHPLASLPNESSDDDNHTDKMQLEQEIQDLSAAEQPVVEQQASSLSSNDDNNMVEDRPGGDNAVIVVSESEDENYQEIAEEEMQVIQAEQSAILPLALGLAVTISILVMVACRVHIMKKRMQDKRYKYLKMDEEDYLINGMYL